jgi:hypothetical protein
VAEPEWGAWVDEHDRYHYRDVDDAESVWASAQEVAAGWWDDSAVRGSYHGEWQTRAHPLVSDLLRVGSPAVIDVLQALVDLAESDDELSFLGAGPLEDLLSHEGHGHQFVNEIERRARQQPRFRTALGGVWLGRDVDAGVRERLGLLGATLL